MPMMDLMMYAVSILPFAKVDVLIERPPNFLLSSSLPAAAECAGFVTVPIFEQKKGGSAGIHRLSRPAAMGWCPHSSNCKVSGYPNVNTFASKAVSSLVKLVHCQIFNICFWLF